MAWLATRLPPMHRMTRSLSNPASSSPPTSLGRPPSSLGRASRGILKPKMMFKTGYGFKVCTDSTDAGRRSADLCRCGRCLCTFDIVFHFASTHGKFSWVKKTNISGMFYKSISTRSLGNKLKICHQAILWSMREKDCFQKNREHQYLKFIHIISLSFINQNHSRSHCQTKL